MVEIDSMEINYLRGFPREARGTATVEGQPCAVRAWRVQIDPRGWYVLAPRFVVGSKMEQEIPEQALENFFARPALRETFCQTVTQAADCVVLFDEGIRLFQRFPIFALALMRMAPLNPKQS